MEIVVDFPGGARVDAHFDSFTIPTDQPPSSTAPTPFSTFLSSIGTCAGIYVLGFCRQRGIATEGMKIVQRVETDPETHVVSQISLDIHLPSEFPEKYKQAVIRSADQCAVKKAIAHPPQFKIKTVAAENQARS